MSLQPSVRLTVIWDKVDGSGTDTFRWSTRPLVDENFFTEGRVLQFGQVARMASSPEGDYQVANGSITMTDADGLFRGRMADVAARYPTAREALWELLSEQKRATDPSVWRTLWHGRISDAQPEVGRKFRLTVADEVGSHFSGFDLEKLIGVRMTRDIFPDLPDDNVNRIFPIVIGEHSDIGAVNENGLPADKGLLPVIDAGPSFLFDDGTYAPAGTTAVYIQPPNLQAPVVNGTPGTATYSYYVTALTENGETHQTGGAVVSDGPTFLNATDSITLTWGPDEPGDLDEATGFRIYRNYSLIAEVDATTFTYTDVGVPGSGRRPPATNTASLNQTIDGETVTGWHMLVLKIGAASEIFHIYASDLGDTFGGTPQRIRMPEEVYGQDFLVYGRPGYPHADPFIELGGVRFAVIYARGPRLQHHLDGVVTIAWNGCGDDDVGDGSGTTLTEAFRCLQHFLNEYILKNSGIGYLTGNYGPLETFANGTAKLKTSAYEACQDTTVEWIGDRGYQAAFALVEPISLREFLRRFLVTFSCHLCANHHGQVYPFLIPNDIDTTAGRHYRDRIEIKRLVGERISHEDAITRVVYHYDFDTDAQHFRVTDQIAEDTDAAAAQKTIRERSARECFCTRDEATAVDAQTRHLFRYSVAPRYIQIAVNLLGLEDENGAQIRLTHYDTCGGVDGDVNTPMIVVGHAFGFDNTGNPEAILTIFDLSRVGVVTFANLENEAAMTGNLGDETSLALPPVGAFELA